MDNKDNNRKDTIDLRVIFSKLIHHKRTYLLSFVVAFVVAYIWILPIPRYYDSSVSLAPEMTSSDLSNNSLGSIASSFGINLGAAQSADAIYPELYPDLLSSSNFIVSLFNIKVTTEDGTLTTDYYTYLTKHQKRSPWSYPGMWIQRLINQLTSKKHTANRDKSKAINAFNLTEREDGIVNKLRNNITCSVDRKNNVITIKVRDQDRKICATVADSVRVRLQDFITNYRTSKARNDVLYYQKLATKAKHDYERVRQAYGRYADANMDVILESYKSKQEDLENDMQLKFNAYSAFNTQLQAARAKLQERTPAFTVIQQATMPIRPAGPKRMIFVMGMMILAFIVTSVWILRQDLKDLFLPEKN